MTSSAPRVAIVDYQMSNLFSVRHACEHVGLDAEVTSNPGVVAAADIVILPGVGAFKDAMSNLHRLGLVSPILDSIAEGKPFLGVCLGLQLLFDGSEEFGGSEGLGILPGRVVRFPDSCENGDPLKVPHIGWNRIQPQKGFEDEWSRSLFQGIAFGEYMYFVHSFHVQPLNQDHVLAVTEYGGRAFCSAVATGNVFATQFHPEKSGETGLLVYKNLRRG